MGGNVAVMRQAQPINRRAQCRPFGQDNIAQPRTIEPEVERRPFEQRGLFRAADGRQIINADVNGAYNIIRKAIPGAFGQGKAGVVVHPVGTAPTH